MILFPDYLFNVGKAASTQVAKTAIQIKDTVEEKVSGKMSCICRKNIIFQYSYVFLQKRNVLFSFEFLKNKKII